MPLAVGVGIWVRCLVERLSGVAAEGIKCGGLTESWEVDEEEVPNCNAGVGGGIEECLRDLLRDLCMGGTTLAARHGRRRPRGNRDWKRGTLIGWWVSWGGDGRRREYSVSAGYAKVGTRFAVIVSAFPR